VKLDRLDVFVLDEADRMLDMGFIHDVRKVIAKLPAERQTQLFSATMPAEIAKLANTILRDPVKVEVAPVSSTAETIDQKMYFVDRTDKNELLVHVLQDPAITEALVFTRTKHGANKVAKVLLKHGISAEAIHGNKSQNARQAALKNFKEGRTRVLVATDIAARGIDIDGLGHVINFDVPNVPETYVHRIGRTGRAGAEGRALSFCDHEEKEYLRDITRLIRREVPVVEDHPFVMTGPPKKKPAPEPREPRQGGRGGRQRTEGTAPRTPRAPRNAKPSGQGEDARTGAGRNRRRGGRDRRRGGQEGREGARPLNGATTDAAEKAAAPRQPRPEGQGRRRSDAPRKPRPKQGEGRRTERRPAGKENDPIFRELFDDSKLVQRTPEEKKDKKKGSLLDRLFGR
jgi:ATP-dependent RNA helicase RhlE